VVPGPTVEDRASTLVIETRFGSVVGVTSKRRGTPRWSRPHHPLDKGKLIEGWAESAKPNNLGGVGDVGLRRLSPTYGAALHLSLWAPLSRIHALRDIRRPVQQRSCEVRVRGRFQTAQTLTPTLSRERERGRMTSALWNSQQEHARREQLTSFFARSQSAPTTQRCAGGCIASQELEKEGPFSSSATGRCRQRPCDSMA
jgi:hypothetical protein